MRRNEPKGAVAVLAVALASCGGGTPSLPSATPAPAPVAEIAAGSIFTVVSGETGAPVAGASVQVGAATYTTNSGGRITLTSPASVNQGRGLSGTVVVITAPGFLVRRHLLRSLSEMEYTLWPATVPSKNLDENLTAELIYTSGAYCCPPTNGGPGNTRAIRMRSPITVPVGMPDVYRGRDAEEAVLDGLDLVNRAAEGVVTFVDSGTATGEVRISENLTGMTPDGRPASAYFQARFEGDYIRGGEVVISVAGWAKLPPSSWDAYYSRSLIRLRLLVAHELGHCLGLQHHQNPEGMMTSYRDGSTFAEYLEMTGHFSKAELLLLKLVYQRHPGNMFPDSDDTVVFSSTARRTMMLCVWPPGGQVDARPPS